jgi:nucleoside-diphosphate-sugar epimerase
MVFLIGGRGLVGSAFGRALEASGHPFAILDRQSYASYVGRSCELLINANGNSRKPLASEQPLADFDASVRSVRASLADFRFERYVHLSSCDVYPDCSSPQTTLEDLPLDVSRQSPYGFHKYLAEQCVRNAARDWLIIRFGGFVGPGLKKNAVFDILNGGPLWLHPASQLQFLHTDDAARIVLDLVGRGLSKEIVNVCGRGLISLQEAIAATGRPIAFQPNSPAVRYDVSIEKLSRWVIVPQTRATVLSFLSASAPVVR